MQFFRMCFLMFFLLCALSAQAVLTLPGQMAPAGKIETVLKTEGPVYHVRRAELPPAIAIEADAWRDVPAMVLDQQEQASGEWNGPADLSGSLRLLWDDQGLYFCLQVTDDIHSAPLWEIGYWENDGCQFAFDAYLNGPKGGLDADEHSYVVSDSPHGPVFASYRMPVGQSHVWEVVHQDKPVAIRKAADGSYIYEWMMTWEQLAPVSPWTLGRCGFSFLLNDCDGTGRKSRLNWTNGVAAEDAGQFGQIIFDDAAASGHAAVLGLRPEEKLTGQETNSRWLNVEGAAPWRTARLLVTAPAGGKVTASATVYRFGDEKKVAEGALTQELPAGEPVVFAWDVSELPDDCYQVEYRVKGLDAVPLPRQTFPRFDMPALKAKAARLRTQFGTDRPWDPMTDAPALVRKHRGLVAVLLQQLEDEFWAHRLVDVDKHDEYLKALAQGAAMIRMLEQGNDYLAAQQGMCWGAYYSPADGSGQSFVIGLPPDYNPQKRYPLMLYLHGSGGVFSPECGRLPIRDYIEVQPWGRGAGTGYRALGENDILEVINFMKTWYRIDDDRVYINGMSMGGSGAWRLASCFPDIFAAAAPMCGDAEGQPLENLRNVPVFDQRGSLDSPDRSRYPVNTLKAWGYPVLYHEIPNSPHNINGAIPPQPWLLQQRRSEKPAAVTFTTGRPDPPYNRAYWLTIHTLVDPHLPAHVTARVISGMQQSLTVEARNTGRLELDLTNMPVNRRHDLYLQVGDNFLIQQAPLPERLHLLLTATGWQTGAPPAPAQANPARAYRAGGASNLYTGEPLLIVYGTRNEERSGTLRAMADSLAQFCGAGGAARVSMPAGRFTVKADREVTADDLLHYSLLILGGPDDNTLAAAMLPRLPITLTVKNELIAGTRIPLNMDGGRFCLSYYNPLAPARLICLLAFDGKRDLAKEEDVQYIRYAIPGIWQDAPGDIPDLMAQSPAGGRNMQFTDGWQWLELPGADRTAPIAYFDGTRYTRLQLQVIRRMAQVDFALDYVEKEPRPAPPEAQPYDMSLADLAIERTPLQTALTEMTGEELLALADHLPAWAALAAEPSLDPQAIDPKRVYHIAIAASMLGDITRVGKPGLTNPRPGPAISQEVLWKALEE